MDQEVFDFQALASLIHEDAKLVPPEDDSGLSLASDVLETMITQSRSFSDHLLIQIGCHYLQLNPTARLQLHTMLHKHYQHEDSYVWLVFFRLYHGYYYPRTILECVTPHGTLPEHLSYLYCYNETDNQYVRFTRALGTAPDQYVFVGTRLENGMEVVIKWTSDEADLDEEIQNMRLAQELGVPMFWFDYNFYFWNRRVLVMEKLEPLTTNDDPRAIARDIIPALQKLHRFAVHNDIKPENIMKKHQTYYLIDYGGIATKPKHYGWERQIWSPLWSSQVKEYGQVTTPKYDLIELMYTLQYLDRWTETTLPDEHSIRDVVMEPWRTGLELIRTYPEAPLTEEDYTRLLVLLTT